ncbi:Cyclic beta-1,2-glucan modification transmembrane protein [hydrothermal vent metagenome]|uniref:Cyclic beta-1,2-glucan modification transmembrane protein n=1 Tax=hydrothermal vent metagenome TaxID=652676 RepID=A0A1W1D0K5_9ZZZZ
MSDFSNILMVNDFSFVLMLGILFFIFLIMIPLSLIILSCKTIHYRRNIIFILTKITIIISFAILLFTPNNYLLKHFNYINYSQAKTIKYNGRFASFIYYDCISHLSAEKVLAYKQKDIHVNAMLFPEGNLTQKPNIHLIVLESFVDPRLLKGITYNRSPLAKELQRYLGKQGFSHLRSPVYGGGTAQAEFEILTGIKAFGKVDSVDFNTLRGERMSGFIDSLNRHGYQNYASIATSSEYFNSILAYKSIGLEHFEFLEETKDFEIREGDKHIFDGDLFAYNLKKIQALPKDKPYLFYTLGMYGHIPYERNKLRPSIIFPSSEDHRIKRIANQFYYRTRALGKYIDEILALDPHAIIYVSSDHLPAIVNDGIKYKKDRKVNIAFLLVEGKNISLDGLPFYHVPRYIWELLNERKFIDKHDRDAEKSLYFKVLSESLSK